MIVYGSSVSPFVRKVLVFIAEKQLATEHRPVGFHHPSAEFKAASPLGLIPGFADGAYNLADSSAICHYLERKHPAPPLFPHDAEPYGRAIWFDEYADTIMFPNMQKIFFNLFVMPRLYKKDGDMAQVEQGLAALPAIFNYLESQIAGPFLVGESLTIADIAIASPFVNLRMVKKPIDAERWPKLASYVEAIHARPSFVLAKDQKAAA